MLCGGDGLIYDSNKYQCVPTIVKQASFYLSTNAQRIGIAIEGASYPKEWSLEFWTYIKNQASYLISSASSTFSMIEHEPSCINDFGTKLRISAVINSFGSKMTY